MNEFSQEIIIIRGSKKYWIWNKMCTPRLQYHFRSGEHPCYVFAPSLLFFFFIWFFSLFLSSFSNRQPRPASSASSGGHQCVWGALPTSSSTTCGLRGRGGRSRSLQWSLRWRRPPLGPQGLFRERSVTGNTLWWSAILKLDFHLHFCNNNFLWWYFSQLWPSITIPRTRRMSCPSWKEPSSTLSRKTMTAGSKGSATASPDCSQETTLSRSCTMLTKREKEHTQNSTAVLNRGKTVNMYRFMQSSDCSS